MSQDAYWLVVNQARKNLVDFEIATNKNYIPNWHHDLIGRELEHIEAFGDRDYKILLVSVPPRHGKSQQCSIDFPAWYLGRNPKGEIIVSSYSSDLAQDFGGKTREKVASVEYQAIFPEVKLKEDEKARGRWRTDQGGSYMAVGVGGPITGRGANILLIDDPVKNREEAESEVMQDKIWDWFTSTAFTRLEPNGVCIVIMTRWHLNDLAGRILAHPELSKRTKQMVFPAITDKDQLPYRSSGEPLWPDRYPIHTLAEIKTTIGPYDWSCTPEETPILMGDWTFKKIKDVKAGEVVVGFENGKGTGRSRLVPSIVKNTFSKVDDIFSLKMDSGRTVKCTKDHRWYNGRIEEKGKRKAYVPPKVGRELMFHADPNIPINDSQLHLWNYLGGIIDGEGHIGDNTLNITQTSGKNRPVLDRIKSTLDTLGVSYNEKITTPENPKWSQKYELQLRNVRDLYLKILKIGCCAKKDQIIHRLFNRAHRPIRETDKVLEINFERRDNVYALETETGNYIAWGYISSNSLYNCSPVLTENQEFNPSWLRTLPEASVGMMNCRRFLTVDTAMSRKTEADYTGFCDNRVNDQNFWHIKAWQAKIGPEELVDALFSLHKTNQYETIGIEKTAYLEGLKPFLDSEQRKRNTFLPIVELDHRQTAKEIRIRGLIPRYASGSVFHVEGACKDLEEQMRVFPVGIHDDVIDALAYQLQIADGSKSASVSVSVRDYTI